MALPFSYKLIETIDLKGDRDAELKNIVEIFKVELTRLNARNIALKKNTIYFDDIGSMRGHIPEVSNGYISFELTESKLIINSEIKLYYLLVLGVVCIIIVTAFYFVFDLPIIFMFGVLAYFSMKVFFAVNNFAISFYKTIKEINNRLI